ncbi:MBL fold metallo-hydrolase [Geopsychrobacter electrodiphilus]|uniref:MBL fold metallo-hydrolase n=1 Tax=Geopsychrobacter electrodiphilus TaxID=225196 RepID=UPI00036E93A5|nr:MBL fold metallo-hydrolase [Geopsychrobacter electrodiphilus]
MRVCLLASGSRGNATLIESDGCHLLIDAGLSAREIDRRLREIGLSADDLDALLVTHEHHDHVSGIGPLARRHKIPVYIVPETAAAISRLGSIADIRYITAGQRFTHAGLEISSFSTTHDAVDPIGFTIDSREGRIGYATDLGLSTRLVVDRLEGSRILVLESNHDEQMLLDGPYPWHLKQRIQGRHGHLSNRSAAELLQRLAWDGLEAVFLAHLSEENNHPELAQQEIARMFATCPGCTPQIFLGQQASISHSFCARGPESGSEESTDVC